MLPSLHAEESMRAAEYLGVGTGAIKPAAARGILARWRRELGQRAPAAKATPEMLSMMGIGYRVVTKGG